MKIFQASHEIDAPVAEVWEVLAEVMAWAQWTPTVNQIEGLDGPELAVGHRFKISQPKLQPATWTVMQLDPRKHFTWESRSRGLTMSADHILEAVGEGSTRVQLTFSFHGPIGTLVAWLYGTLVASYLETEAASLKRRAEALSSAQQSAV